MVTSAQSRRWSCPKDALEREASYAPLGGFSEGRLFREFAGVAEEL